MVRPLAYTLIVGILSLVMAWHGAAVAQPDAIERIDALHSLSEKDNAQALQQLVVLGQTLGADAPYTTRREYLSTLIDIQVDAAKMDAVETSVSELLKLAQVNKDPIGVVLATVKSAHIMVLSGKTEAALSQLVAVESMALQTADARALWHFYSTLGNAQLTVGRFEAALESTIKSLHYAKDQPKQAKALHLRSLNLLGKVYMAMTNWDKALQVIEEALVVANEVGSRKLQGTLYLNQGATLASLGRPKASVEAYEKALRIGQESGLVGLQGTALNNIGDSYLISKNYPKAEVFARQAIDKFKEAGELGGIATAQSNVGFALMGQGKTQEGSAMVRAAIQFSKGAGAKTDEEAILGELGRMYEQAGLYHDAVTTIREQQTLTAQLFRADREKTVATLQAQFDSVQRQKQIELLARENSLKDAEISNQRLQKIITLLGTLVTVLGGAFVFLLYRRVREANQKLLEVNQQLEFHSVRDPLTGLFNRRSFLELMHNRTHGVTNGRREGDDPDSPDGLMILDVDHFKNINDTMGHSGGDAVLIEIAKRLRSTVRDTDMVMRWGGEEFLIYSPKSDAEHLKNLAVRVLKVIGQTPMVVADKTMHITVTGGFLSLPFSGLSEVDCNWEKAIQIADMALYLGKVNGRNRAYGLNRLLMPFEQVMPVLERDISAALKGDMVELVEVIGPELDAGAGEESA
ncbi:MAG TPA: diguanylate cyclase [Rhodoferax sp.]|jgi:diguanylate cyclase (GGDEF)-like protein|nr:tetratricopeptide repeat-containing diguanylate cyclase [Rhodoferax sp.]HPW28821.1 diguanylate cyclase [Rhodoferax sp.]